MCRVLAYLGEPLLLEDLLYKPDVSFVNQTYRALFLQRLNLAGSGLCAWDARSPRPEFPFVHRTTQLAIYDRNLRALARKVEATCLLAHRRGVAYDVSSVISEQNLHPFLYDGARLALAHNGQLADFDRMKFGLLPHLRPELAQRIRGTTDSEWIYALVLSQLPDASASLAAGEIVRAVQRALRIIVQVRRELGIDTFSPLNLFLTDGDDLVAVCCSLDRGNYAALGSDYHPPDELALQLWYTRGSSYGFHDGEWKMRDTDLGAQSVIVASEPLTRDHDTWHAVPLQHLVYVRRTSADAAPAPDHAAPPASLPPPSRGGPRVEVVPLDLGA
jgi:glutamine amidotransferase